MLSPDGTGRGAILRVRSVRSSPRLRSALLSATMSPSPRPPRLVAPGFKRCTRIAVGFEPKSSENLCIDSAIPRRMNTQRRVEQANQRSLDVAGVVRWDQHPKHALEPLTLAGVERQPCVEIARASDVDDLVLEKKEVDRPLIHERRGRQIELGALTED
jgi:hypothetical protein